jgi:hypothetical protein
MVISPARDTYLRSAFYEPEMGYFREGAAAPFVNLLGRHSVIPHLLLTVRWISSLSFVLWIGPMCLSVVMCLCAGIYHSKWFLFPIHWSASRSGLAGYLQVQLEASVAEKFWPKEDAIGKRFARKGREQKPITVVGIVQDAKYKGITETPQPFFYVPLEQSYVAFRTLQVRTSAPACDASGAN